jgi:plasmid stabilization system protein ParE
MKIEIIPEAQDDILNGMFWYESQKTGLGIDFFSEIEQNLSVISQNPLLGRKFRSEFRRFVMKKFPFCIYYLTEFEKIVFLGFIHAHRDPHKISEWLRSRLQ